MYICRQTWQSKARAPSHICLYHRSEHSDIYNEVWGEKDLASLPNLHPDNDKPLSINDIGSYLSVAQIEKNRPP